MIKKIGWINLLKIILITFLPILFVHLPFVLNIPKLLFLEFREVGFANILKNWDGPHYIVVAKTLYNLDRIAEMLFIPIDVRYYYAHFPLFPLFIRLLSPVMGWIYSGLFINLALGLLLNLLFYEIAKKYTSYPLFLTFLFTVFPARFWVVRSIISPETLMLFLILLSFYFWQKRGYFLCSFFGFLAVLTKIQAIFLFPAYAAEVAEKVIFQKNKIDKGSFWIILIPLSFVALSLFYYIVGGDFFAFLHAEKGNNLFIYFPFSQFNYQGGWAGTAWLEDVVFYFIAMFALTFSMYKDKERSWFYFSLFYTLFLVFIPQRDITRFAYPLLPFFLIKFQNFLTSKTFRIAFLFSLPALYFYTVNFIIVNQAPIMDWTRYIK
jgi:hypothetical protein